nr:Ycf53 [Porphyropsis coccinea]
MVATSEDLSVLSSLLDDITLSKKMLIIEKVNLDKQDNLYALYHFFESKLLQNQSLPDCIDGTIYKLLMNSKDIEILNLLKTNFKDGLLNNNSKFFSSYVKLQQLLLDNDFQEADIVTSQLLCLLADLNNRQWLYFSDVGKIPPNELKILDNLWKIFSKGKFGFSVQRQLWLNSDKDWNQLWDKIGWRHQETLSRYPEGFIWDVSAPVGHLPLSNQLRGVQTINSLFQLKIWNGDDLTI